MRKLKAIHSRITRLLLNNENNKLRTVIDYLFRECGGHYRYPNPFRALEYCCRPFQSWFISRMPKTLMVNEWSRSAL